MQTPYGIPPPAYRLPNNTHVGRVHLLVSDLARSLAYYKRIIGLKPLVVESESAVLGTHGEERPLVTLQTKEGVMPARQGAFGLFHFAILLPERAALGRFAASIASSTMPLGMADHLVSESLYLWDPDGLGIEVYADRPRNDWQCNGRELAMATDPLDIVSVIAAGERHSWEGVPAGTTIGHVHLHVGHLETAESFYHRALGFDKTVWSYPGALFMAAGGYHHHVGTNVWAPGPAPAVNQAQLMDWELVLPSRGDIAAAGHSLRSAGYDVEDTAMGIITADPWRTRIQILA